MICLLYHNFMKKLFLVFTEFPPKFGGMQTHALNMSNILSKSYQVIVYTYKSVDLIKEASDFDSKMDFPIHRVLSRVSFYGNIRILKQEILKHKPDLIYSSTVFYGVLKQYTSTPIICRSVGNDILRPWIIYPFKFGSKLIDNYLTDNLFNSIKKNLSKPPFLDIIFVKKRKKLAIEAAKSANLILSNSNFTQNIFLEHNINNSTILVGGVDSKHYEKPVSFDKNMNRNKLGFSPETFLIITSGRFVKKKGIDFLIDSFIKLEETYNNIEFIIIGDGPMRDQLELQASVSSKIHFTGKKTQTEIREYYWISDLYVLGSRVVKNDKTGFKDVETMGRVLCEANAASLPVLASDSGGISSIIEHKINGLLYETDNFESFKNYFELIYKNKELSDDLVDKGLIKARNEFDWSVLAKKHINIFESMS